MADARREDRKPTTPNIDLTWSNPELAPDNTYSTTLYIFVGGSWMNGLPDRARFRVDGADWYDPVPIFNRRASKPLTNLLPGSHCRIEVEVRGLIVERLLLVPPLPKQKTTEQERNERAIADLELDTKLAGAERANQEARRAPPPIIPKLSVEPLGFKPNLRFIVHLTDHEIRGTAGKVEVSTRADPTLFEIVEVDSSGSTIWPPRDASAITFPDKRRTYRFRIAGADLKDKERTCECVVS
ncbi:hypothetical protein HYW67_03575 [Candidatus Parcubacteria bacterium]|nr:hypothetical protein [Candidatus Parcubacteria bacterium]